MFYLFSTNKKNGCLELSTQPFLFIKIKPQHLIILTVLLTSYKLASFYYFQRPLGFHSPIIQEPPLFYFHH